MHTKNMVINLVVWIIEGFKDLLYRDGHRGGGGGGRVSPPPPPQVGKKQEQNVTNSVISPVLGFIFAPLQSFARPRR